MNRTLSLLAVSGLVLVAGCSKPSQQGGSGGGNVTAAETANMLSPGQWQGTMHFEKFDLGKEMPPQVKQAMERAMGVDKQFSSCLTAEEAARPRAGFFGGESGCENKSFTMANGHIEAEAVCNRPEGTQTMKMSGQYSKDDYTMHIETQANMRGMPMNMAMSMTAHRTGACTGKEN